MAYSCWRCTSLYRALPRPTQHHLPPEIRSAFHTSQLALATPPKAKPGGKTAERAIRKAFRKTKKGASAYARPKSYNVGERKALKTRVILANGNALPVQLPPITEGLAVNEEAVGNLFGIPTGLVERLRTLQAFQKRQMWQYFHRPSTMLRPESLQLGRAIAEVNGEKHQFDFANAAQGISQGSRATPLQKSFIINGPAGTGKSILMLQAMVWAMQRDWILIHINNAQDLSLGHTEYAFNPNTGLWDQPVYLQGLLKKILETNRALLERRRLTGNQHSDTVRLPQDATLAKLVEMGAREPDTAVEVWNMFLEQLSHTSSPPVLFTMDNLNYIMGKSGYKNPEFEDLHCHDFSLATTFLSHLNNKNLAPAQNPSTPPTRMPFLHRGIILTATTSDLLPNPALDLALAHQPLDPYSQQDRRSHASITTHPTVINISGLDRSLTSKLLQYYRQSGVWDDAWTMTEPLPKWDQRIVPVETVGLAQQLKRTEQVGNDNVSEKEMVMKHVLTGGVPRELLRACIRLT